jgi:hypothetical protein
MKYQHILGVLLAATAMLWADGKPDASTNAAPTEKKTAERKAGESKKDAADKDKEPKDELSETTNTVSIHGVDVKYKATAGTLVATIGGCRRNF